MYSKPGALCAITTFKKSGVRINFNRQLFVFLIRSVMPSTETPLTILYLQYINMSIITCWNCSVGSDTLIRSCLLSRMLKSLIITYHYKWSYMNWSFFSIEFLEVPFLESILSISTHKVSFLCFVITISFYKLSKFLRSWSITVLVTHTLCYLQYLNSLS